MFNVGYATLTLIPVAKGLAGRIAGETDGDLDRAGKSGGKTFGGGLVAAAGRFAGPLATVFAGVKIVDFFKDAIAQASDLNEAGNKLQVVFGAATGSILKFAGSGATALGQSTLDLQNAAATFGVYGKAAGLAGSANAKFSTDLVKLSTDLASFYNTDPAQATEAIAAGLRGESEPLRQYGVLLNDATLRTEALRLGLIKTTTQALTPQQRVLAAHAVIMKQTTVAQGDFARTSGGLANQQRILAAQWTNLTGQVGRAFLPAVTKLVTFGTSRLLPFLSGVIGPLGTLGTRFVGLVRSGTAGGGALAKVGGFFASLRPQAVAFVGAVREIGAKVGTVLRGQVLPVLQNLGARAAPLIGQLAATVRTVATEATPILRGLGTVFTWLFKIIFNASTVAALKALWSGVVGILSGALRVIRGVVQIISGIFSGNWSKIWQGAKNVFGGAWQIIVSTLRGVLGALWALISGLGSKIGSYLAGKLSAVGAAIGRWATGAVGWFVSLRDRAVAAVVGLATRVVSYAASMMSRGRAAIINGAGAVLGAVRGFVSGAVTAAAGLPARFVTLAGNVISGFVSGIRRKAGDIIAAIKQYVTDAVPDWVKTVFGIHSPARLFIGYGLNVARGMARGIAQGAPLVLKAARAMTAIPAPSAPATAVPVRGPLVGSLIIQAGDGTSARDQLDEAMFQLRRIAQGACMRDGEWQLAYADTTITFGPPDLPVFVTASPDQGDIDITTDDTARPRGDGRAFGIDTRGARTITFEVATRGTSPSTARDTMAAFVRAWRADTIRAVPGAVAELRTRNAGRERLLYGRPRRIAVTDIDAGYAIVTAVADFACVDDLYYGTEQHTVTVGIVAPTGGGLAGALAAPLSTTATSDRSSVITVDTDLPCWPVVTITGPITNPEVTVTEQWRLALATTLGAGQRIVVDPRPWVRAVLRDQSASLAGALTRDSVRLADMTLPAGAVEVVFRGADATGTASVRLDWRNTYTTL